MADSYNLMYRFSYNLFMLHLQLDLGVDLQAYFFIKNVCFPPNSSYCTNFYEIATVMFYHEIGLNGHMIER